MTLPAIRRRYQPIGHATAAEVPNVPKYFRPLALSQRDDPSEPHLRHENSNCTMVSAALCVRAVTAGAKKPRGGNMRHNQRDQDGPTGLDDAREAAAKYGVTLVLDQGWADMVAARKEGRALIVQGDSGDLDGSCSEGQDVAHAVFVHPDTGVPGAWLVVDPWCYKKGTNGEGKYRWLTTTAIKRYASKLGYRFAMTRKLPAI